MQFKSNSRTISEQFRSDSRADQEFVSEHFSNSLSSIEKQFQCKLRAVQGQFQSSWGAIRELNWSSFQGNFRAVLVQFCAIEEQFQSDSRTDLGFVPEHFSNGSSSISGQFESKSSAISE